jgi:uracil-DNA glycosylase
MLLDIDTGCKECPLGHNQAVPSSGQMDKDKLKLVIISDFPDKKSEEEATNFASNDSDRIPRRLRNGNVSIEKPRNAGSMLKVLLEEIGIDLDTEEWKSNIVKCNPRHLKVKDKDAKTCCKVHFVDELAFIDGTNPSVPILVAGNVAFKALKAIYKDCSFSKSTLKACRKTTHHTLFSHPVFFTYNPGSVCKSEWGVEDTFMKSNVLKITSKKTLEPFVFSPLWIYKEDLRILGKYLKPNRYTLSEDCLF